ncbi:MAG: regulatory protein RecX [Candidatus Omnitrophota bacterium]
MNKALQCAFNLLKYRPRSEYELYQRLKRRGFSETPINNAIFLLKEKNLINDLEFARIWVESRINKPLGLKRIKQELRIKGIKEELIDRALADFSGNYNEEEAIRNLVCQRWERLSHIQPKEKVKQRIFMYLLRRGFSPEKVRQAIRLKVSSSN